MNRQGEPIEDVFQRLRHGPGREESYRILFDRFYWPLFRFFEHRGFSTEECQDLIQETFLRVFRGIEAFRGEARWEHWLFRIAANTAIKAVRHRAAAKRTGHTVPLEDHDPGDSPPAAAGGSPRGAEAPVPLRQLLGKEMRELLTQAVAGLPAQMRRCVRLRVFQDLDYDEIAEALQISPSTVKVQLFKARKRLQLELGDSFVDFDF
jgi:RNA polymerase sigma-70 factor (ECF subfamily)